MTLEEKIENIKENKAKNYLVISPKIIRGGAKLVDSYETLRLYQSMDENTQKFAEEKIVDLISNAEGKEIQERMTFHLIFCGDFDDLDWPDEIDSPSDYIMRNKDKIVAVFRYVKSTEQRKSFIDFEQMETIYKYDYIYLDLAKLLEEFDKHNIKYEIDTTEDRYIPAMYKDETATKFLISYSPDKENKKGKASQLKRIKKS